MSGMGPGFVGCRLRRVPGTVKGTARFLGRVLAGKNGIHRERSSHQQGGDMLGAQDVDDRPQGAAIVLAG